MSNFDVMVVSPHPDDMEIGCGGTMAKLSQGGKKIIALDLTKGEMSSRGDLATRMQESKDAANVLGITQRESLDLKDAFVLNTEENQKKICRAIRQYRPEIVFAPYWECRHPDHYRSSNLTYEALFLAGLVKYEDGLEAFRPNRVIYYMLHFDFQPSFIVDVSKHFDLKVKALDCYQSQFSNPSADEKQTYISGRPFLDMIETRAKFYGQQIGRKYGEAFFMKEQLEIMDPVDLMRQQGRTLNSPMAQNNHK